MKKLSLTNVMLDQLGALGRVTLDAFFPPQYSYARMWRPLLGLDHPPKITRHAVSMNLWRLQKQGLVQKSGGNKSSYWNITRAGKQYLRNQKYSSRDKDFKKDGIIRLVMFDIPERERRKRDAIRAELIKCNFEQLQKSVWIGKSQLPKEFITTIDDLDVSKYVHIFSVREKGTIYDVV